MSKRNERVMPFLSDWTLQTQHPFWNFPASEVEPLLFKSWSSSSSSGLGHSKSLWEDGRLCWKGWLNLMELLVIFELCFLSVQRPPATELVHNAFWKLHDGGHQSEDFDGYFPVRHCGLDFWCWVWVWYQQYDLHHYTLQPSSHWPWRWRRSPSLGYKVGWYSTQKFDNPCVWLLGVSKGDDLLEHSYGCSFRWWWGGENREVISDPISLWPVDEHQGFAQGDCFTQKGDEGDEGRTRQGQWNRRR